jgi:eukaryotic-like serine/threonine-protein kinase
MSQTIGNYQILSELGRGGMGVVYKAFEPALSRTVALKMLNEGIAHDQGLVERFYREARAMATLNDPNVVQIHAVGEHQGQPFFVMEFVDGESLNTRLKRERLSVKESRRIIAQAASGLQAAHEKGLIHRDIKPGNLMLSSNKGLVKVTDFGIALKEGNAERLTGTGGIVGTPGYLSPEACLGEALDVRTDIFALGVVFFEMLTGRLPFDDKSPYALMAAVVQAQIPDVRTLNNEVDAHTMQVLNKMLARRPADRYQSCAEVEAELTQSLTPIPPKAPVIGQVLPQPQTPTPPPVQGIPHAIAAHNVATPAVYPAYPQPQAHAVPQTPAYAPSYPQAPTPYPPAHAVAPAVQKLTIMPAEKKGNGLLWFFGGAGAFAALCVALVMLLQPDTPSESPGSAPTVPDVFPNTEPKPVGVKLETWTEAGTPNPALSELDASARIGAAKSVLGTYEGKLGSSSLVLVLQNQANGLISGYNMANGLQRQVLGFVESMKEEIDADGDTWMVYHTVLHEPGNESGDGKFRINIKHSDDYIGGDGSWTRYTGEAQYDISIQSYKSARN